MRYLIEAGSKEEAIEWAKKLPLLDAGAIEVRPEPTGAQWGGAIRGAHKFLVALVANREQPPSREQRRSAGPNGSWRGTRHARYARCGRCR